MVTAHSREHTLSDNSLFNFGMVHDNVVIIDAGSRSKSPKMSKRDFSKINEATLEQSSNGSPTSEAGSI